MGGKGSDLTARAGRSLTRAESNDAKRQIVRMLSLDDSGVRAFHRVDPRFKRSGCGRLFRSPTLFEDIIKTVTSCNVAWTSTIKMNERFCEVINSAFPTPQQLARRKPGTLRARCSVGYRDQRMVDLAKMHARGEIDPAWFEDATVSDEDIESALLELPGIGPYAAANIMQLLGRYSRIPCDTESVRHGRMVLGMTGTDRHIMKRIHQHYEPFGEHKFRSYWFELWDFYEAKKGKAWTWEPKTTGRSFTASQLKESA
jgi:3-methyladenine DNA glycosylase/8-oxoguanine DNA glycosylase